MPTVLSNIRDNHTRGTVADFLRAKIHDNSHLNIPYRRGRTHDQIEIEAESVAYLVCKRNGCDCNSEAYIDGYLKTHTIVDDLEIYQIMRAAGQIESLLGLTAHTGYEKPRQRNASGAAS